MGRIQSVDSIGSRLRTQRALAAQTERAEAERARRAVLEERTRIARELHDTLLQSFQGVLLRFQAVSNLLPERPADAKQRLDSAIDQAAEAITEGRDAVQGLRSSTVVTNDLALAISALAKELSADETNGNSALFRVEVEGTSRKVGEGGS